MEYLIGIQGPDFVLVAADTIAANSIIQMKHDHDKMFKLSEKILMLCVGEAGDTVQFAEYIQKNVQLYKMRNGEEELCITVTVAEAWLVGWCLCGLKICNPNGLFASETGVSFLALGKRGVKEGIWKGVLCRARVTDYVFWCVCTDLTRDEAVELLKKCLEELKKRFILSLPSFNVRLIDKDGIKDLEKLPLAAA
ncbi:proteasome subunit beta type-2 [Huso huso]|uniref:Proteasome subunit beta n=1 Tax=Huso huso TaxID=61971 RepID=A0ABR0YP47_HUSHU